MSKYDPANDDIDELLRQVDDLLDDDDLAGPVRDHVDPAESWDDEDYFGSGGFEPFAPEMEDEPMVYQNYSNSYGEDIRNYSNGYGGQYAPQKPQYTGPSIPAYNADYQDPRTRRAPKAEPVRRSPEYRDYGQTHTQPAPRPKKPAAPKRRRGCGCGCTTVLLLFGVLIALTVGAVMFLFQPPKSNSSIGPRKDDTAAILLVGADAAADNTDTMMLLYLSGSEKQVSLLSLPRDSLTITSSGKNAKLNSAYARNGKGEEGIQGLMDYVENIIGYRPDGYVRVDMNIVPRIVDVMGGVDVEVPMDMEVDGMTLSAGMQHLDGSQVLTLLRFRKGYAMADLGRVEVQRTVLKACIDQWTSPEHIADAFSALDIVSGEAGTSLTVPNFLWVGKTLLLNASGGFATETLPGVPEYIGGQSFYILDLEDIAGLINESYNPYQVTIDADDLSITGD